MAGRMGLIAAVLVLLAAAPAAEARELTFRSSLRGDRPPTDTGSKATGAATIVVDTERQTVVLQLDVAGLKMGDLWDRLAASPIGPIHLHLYPSHDHSNPDAAALVFIAPLGRSYTATSDGFRVRIEGFSYAEAARVLRSDIPFDRFVAALEQGVVVLNIHTNAKPDGEISGPVLPADPATVGIRPGG